MSNDHDDTEARLDAEQGEVEEVTLEELFDMLRTSDADSAARTGACLVFVPQIGKIVCVQTKESTCRTFKGRFKPGQKC